MVKQRETTPLYGERDRIGGAAQRLGHAVTSRVLCGVVGQKQTQPVHN
jgi:hypothetical protein